MYQIPVQDIHPPELIELRRLMEQAIKLETEMKQRSERARRSLEHTDASAWTSRIEAALDKPDELEVLKVQRREALIEADALLFGFYAIVDQFNTVKEQLFKAIGAVVARTEMHAHHQDEWLKPILVNAAMEAENVRRSRQMWDDRLPNRVDADRSDASLAALLSAFAQVATVVKEHRSYEPSLSQLDYAFKGLYPLEGAVLPAAVGSGAKREEMRICLPQPFVDTTNTKHPALAKLAELMPLLNEAVRRAREAANALRSGEKGKVNERQYAARLLTVLDQPQNTCGSYGPEQLKEEQKRQNTARVAYQSQRTVLYSELVAAEHMRRQVLAALREAIVETEALEADINRIPEAPPGQYAMVISKRPGTFATTDQLFTRRLALVNCIAADVLLRQTGRQLLELLGEYSNDITNGKGANATAHEFADLKRYYDSFKNREDATAGGDSPRSSGGGRGVQVT